MTLREEAFENILGKGENAGNQHFLIFPKCFPPFPPKNSIFSQFYFVVFKCLEFELVWNFVIWKGVNEKKKIFIIALSLYIIFISLPDDIVLDWFKLRQTADDILKCI